MNLLLPILDMPQRHPRAFSLIDQYLREQQQLTAVDRFARHHAGLTQPPAQSKYYRDLIPLQAPGPGQQYAFEVDMDACSGCKSCVAACHQLNGLDAEESWRSVGLLVGGTMDAPVMQHVTSACHHCVDPACLTGCPVNAYEKDPVTGIVKHLDDQCIGCQYCILKCPYDVPRYNSRLGIVRKCDMCSDRLATNEAPACVQSCPNQAIRISLVNRENIIEESESNLFVPGAAEPDYTLPTTNYKTRHALPRNLLPADHHQIQAHDAHMPLVVMLVLTQLSVGAFCAQQLFTTGIPDKTGSMNALLSLGLAFLALGASTLHLGRPRYAFRAILGLRRSWLSREILGFGLFALMGAVYAVALWQFPRHSATPLVNVIEWSVIGIGIMSVGASAMVYHDTRRPCWHIGWTGVKFALTTAMLGVSTLLLSASLASLWVGTQRNEALRHMMHAQGASLCRLLAGLSALKMGYESLAFLYLRDRGQSAMKRSAKLLWHTLRSWTQARFAVGFLGGLLLPGFLVWNYEELLAVPLGVPMVICLILAIFLGTFLGELLERRLFFVAAVAPKMPGAVSS